MTVSYSCPFLEEPASRPWGLLEMPVLAEPKISLRVQKLPINIGGQTSLLLSQCPAEMDAGHYLPGEEAAHQDAFPAWEGLG